MRVEACTHVCSLQSARSGRSLGQRARRARMRVEVGQSGEESREVSQKRGTEHDVTRFDRVDEMQRGEEGNSLAERGRLRSEVQGSQGWLAAICRAKPHRAGLATTTRSEWSTRFATPFRAINLLKRLASPSACQCSRASPCSSPLPTLSSCSLLFQYSRVVQTSIDLLRFVACLEEVVLAPLPVTTNPSW